MAAAFSYTACPKLSLLQPPMAAQIRPFRTSQKAFVVTNPEQDNTLQEQDIETIKEEQPAEKQMKKQPTPLRPVEKQSNVKSTGLPREFGGEWLSSVTRHVRIYAAYIDPETCEFDQTQIDKLTLILDPTEEFVWEDESCNKVYSYFQELVDHYEGAPLTEYTLRLIGSDVEHYIRKMLFDGEIQYNMDARVLNFSMGKPRVQFNTSNIEGTTRVLLLPVVFYHQVRSLSWSPTSGQFLCVTGSAQAKICKLVDQTVRQGNGSKIRG